MSALTPTVGKISSGPGTFLLSQVFIDPQAATGGAWVPVPPGATYVTLTAQGGDARYNAGGAATSTQGYILTDGVEKPIPTLPTTRLRVYAEVGVKVAMEAYHDPNIFRPITAFEHFGGWQGYSWTATSPTTIMGAKAWEILGGTWTVSESNAAVVNSVAPNSDSVDNLIVVDTGAFYGWYWAQVLMAPTKDAGLVWGCADKDNFWELRCYDSTHASFANTLKLYKRVAGVETLMDTWSGFTIDPNVPHQLSVMVRLVGANNYCFPYFNGKRAGAPTSMSSTFFANHKAGGGTLTTGRIVSFGHCGL